MQETIAENKFVELAYRVTDRQSGAILVQVDMPLAYVQGHNSQLLKRVTKTLAGKSVGDKIEVPIDCSDIFGKRDTSLIFTDDLENVPKKYRKIGTKITMANAKDKLKDFFVTQIKDGKLTVDGNHPLCDKSVIFSLEVLSIRDATKAEIAAGGAITKDDLFL